MKEKRKTGSAQELLPVKKSAYKAFHTHPQEKDFTNQSRLPPCFNSQLIAELWQWGEEREQPPSADTAPCCTALPDSALCFLPTSCTSSEET